MSKLAEKQMNAAMKADAEKLSQTFEKLFGEITDMHARSQKLIRRALAGAGAEAAQGRLVDGAGGGGDQSGVQGVHAVFTGQFRDGMRKARDDIDLDAVTRCRTLVALPQALHSV